MMESLSPSKSLCFRLFCCISLIAVVVGNTAEIPPPSLVIEKNIFTDLLDRVKELEERENKLSNRVFILEDEGREQRTEIDKMKKELTTYKKRNTDMASELTETKKQNLKLKTAIRTVKKKTNMKINNLKTMIIEVLSRQDPQQKEAPMAGPETTTNSHEDVLTTPYDVDKNRSEDDLLVAFFARLKTSLLHEGSNQNIVFEDVETNIGKAYNSHHGVFIAPVTGTYVFSSSLLAYMNSEVYCNLAVNADNKARIYAKGTDNKHDQSSQTIIIHLKQGDDVSVQNVYIENAIFGDGYSTFSGFLLQQDFPANEIVG